ncbi:protein kinase, partial [Candidatus Woesearchaeota archaeon]|nr:protein kinase [Candidatus Woesearchaeota archaeon]
EMTLDEYVSGFEGTAIPVIKMEKLDGIALNQYLHDNRDNTKFDFRQKTKLSRAIAEALSLFHSAGYIHRDVKPDNIFVKEDGGDYSVRFVDCGLVTKLSRLPASKEFSGSIRYMPLEHIYAADPQRRNWAVARRETDIFSLGAVMHKIFEGESPVDYAMTQARRNYDAAHRGNPSWDRNKRDIAELGAVAESLRSEDYLETLRFMVEEVTDDYLNTPEGMIDLVMYRCLQKDINMRYSNCEDVVMELEYALRLLDEREKNDVARQLMPEKPPLESGLYIIRDDKVVRVDGPEIPYSVKAPRTVLRAV